MADEFVFGCNDVSVDDIWALASGRSSASLSLSDSFRNKLNRSVAYADQTLRREGVIYGVTTGYGDSCTTPVSATLIEELPLHLTRFHGCGLGRILTPTETRAVMAVRIASLARGWSGVRVELVELLVEML